MKKLFFTLLAFAVVTSSMAFSVVTSTHKKASEIYIPIGGTNKTISLADLSKISVKDFENLSGRHLNFFDRIGFRMAQKKLRKSINADGTISNKRLEKFLDRGDPSTGFNIGGFALGFFVGLIGVLIAYLINDDYKKNRVKWAWIGFGIAFVLYLVLILAVIASVK
jgi:hypothetical protein